MSFKVGQRYKVTACGNNAETGNVIEITNVFGENVIYKTVKGINLLCSGFEKESPFAKCLIPLHNECIVIYRKGEETVALDKTTGKQAVARCSQQDEYDFYTGAKLAFERLTGTEEEQKHVNCRCSLNLPKKYFNGKAVCICESSGFTIGKVYEFKDGRTVDDDGDLRPLATAHDAVTTGDKWFKDRFLQLIE